MNRHNHRGPFESTVGFVSDGRRWLQNAKDTPHRRIDRLEARVRHLEALSNQKKPRSKKATDAKSRTGG